MATEKELKLAKEAYDTLCRTLDKMEWNYEKDDENFIIRFGVRGDDIPMKFVVACDAERQLIRLMSYLPFRIKEDKRIDGAIATSYANFLLADGSFDYDLTDGSIAFRMTSSFRESVVGEELFSYMIHVSCMTVDKYNDQFMKISEGALSIADFYRNN